MAITKKSNQNQIENFIQKHLNLNKPTIAFGLLKPHAEILKSLRRSKRYVKDITLVGPPAIKNIKGFKKVIVKNPEKKLAEMLYNNDIDGIVRGTIDDWETIRHYCSLAGLDPEKIDSAPILKDAFGKIFFMNPSSNLQGWTRQERIKLVDPMVEYSISLGIKPRVAIFNATRRESYKTEKHLRDGVFGYINQTFEDAEKMVNYLKKKGLDAKNFDIELSTALDENYNILIPVNGVVGNQIFRALCLIGKGKVIAVPMLNLPHCYEENSRNESDFEPHVKWLVSVINQKKFNALRTNKSKS